MAATWETQLRRMIRDTHGLGWSLRSKGVGTTQITRRWSDNSRSSTTVAIAWRRANGPQLLALIERLARMTAPVADGGQGLALAKAAELIKQFDPNGNGALDLGEFQQLCIELRRAEFVNALLAAK